MGMVILNFKELLLGLNHMTQITNNVCVAGGVGMGVGMKAVREYGLPE